MAPFTQRIWWWISAAVLVVSLPLLTGCGGGKGSVSGKVMYNGTALPFGSVQFMTPGGAFVSEIGSDGSYSLTGIPTGSATISVTCQDPKYADYMKQLSASSRDPKAPKPKGRPEDYSKIPSKYSDFSTSGLTYEIKSGTQTHNIELK